VNIIGTLYKLFFRRLPEPLIPFDKYDALITAQSSHEEEVIVRGIEVSSAVPIDNAQDIHDMDVTLACAGSGDLNATRTPKHAATPSSIFDTRCSAITKQ